MGINANMAQTCTTAIHGWVLEWKAEQSKFGKCKLINAKAGNHDRVYEPTVDCRSCVRENIQKQRATYSTAEQYQCIETTNITQSSSSSRLSSPIGTAHATLFPAGATLQSISYMIITTTCQLLTHLAWAYILVIMVWNLTGYIVWTWLSVSIWPLYTSK